MLAASQWRVRPQRLDGEEDDMTRMMEEDLEERVGGRRANIQPQDSEYIGRKGVSTNFTFTEKNYAQPLIKLNTFLPSFLGCNITHVLTSSPRGVILTSVTLFVHLQKHY
jgi:hypothetical protein